MNPKMVPYSFGGLARWSQVGVSVCQIHELHKATYDLELTCTLAIDVAHPNRSGGILSYDNLSMEAKVSQQIIS